MPKGCVFSLLGSFFILLAGAMFFIEYSVDYSKIELNSFFEDMPYLEIITYLVIVVGFIVLSFGLIRLFTGKQEEPDSTRGGLINEEYINRNGRTSV